MVKEVDLYSAFIVVSRPLKALRYGSHSVTCKIANYTVPAAGNLPLYLVSIHQMAHPQTEVAD